MRAFSVDHATPHHRRLVAVEDRAPGPHQALVTVRAMVLNRGELGSGASQAWDGTGVG